MQNLVEKIHEELDQLYGRADPTEADLDRIRELEHILEHIDDDG